MFERVTGELRAKLLSGGRAWQGFETTHRARSANKTPLVWRAPEGPEGLAAVPVGGGGAWPGYSQRPSPTGVEGAGGSGGPGRGARGRRRGLAGLFTAT